MGQVVSMVRRHAPAASAPVALSAPFNALDVDHLERQSLGDRDLAEELLRLFDCQAAQTLAKLLVTGQNPKFLSDLAHTLKGSARAVGAMAVAEAAQNIEAALAQGLRGEALGPHLAVAGAAVAGARSAIATLLGPHRA